MGGGRLGGRSSRNVRRRSNRKKTGRKESRVAENISNTTRKGISLAKRKDVVNKTLLRSVKRYYTNLFDQFIRRNEYSKQDKREFWKTYIEEFIREEFPVSLELFQEDTSISLEEIKAFIAAMVVPNNIKRSDCEPAYNIILDDFSNLLYKYSIKRLGSFMKNTSVYFVLKHFVENGPLSDLLENDDTLSKNRHLYLKASKEILSLTN